MKHRIKNTLITNYMQVYYNNKTFNVKVIDKINGIIDIEVFLEPTTEERVKIHSYIMDILEVKK
ncbi:MAG: hypothetical protein WCK31_04955 [bacterium]